ncbi:MAG: hypothetical protein QHH80_13615, partial [Anaerolineae bacterium]|nr:hypothetical protein [Anaerolineae bacterium]
MDLERLKDIGTVLGVITGVAAVLELVFSPVRRFLKVRRQLKATYQVVWKPSRRLKPQEVMGLRGDRKRGFREYYYTREADAAIRQRIQTGKHVLILGDPLAGKTRAAYQALKGAKRLAVTIPCPEDVRRDEFRVPRCWAFWRRRIFLVDDLDKFIGKQNFTHLLTEFEKRGVVVATCRSGEEYSRLRAALERERLDLFGEPVHIPAISREEALDVARQTGETLPARFDGRIGSIFLELEAMRQRFAGLDGKEKAILRALKRLYNAGVYRGREVFPKQWLKRVCAHAEQMEATAYRWTEMLTHLATQGFLKLGEEEVEAEEAHLREVVVGDWPLLGTLREVRQALAGDAEGLLLLGNRAWEEGLVSLEEVAFMQMAINAYEEAAGLCAERGDQEALAMTQNNLGNAYRTLAGIQ